jgi:DNA-binding IclR family transcriptional regulator
MGDPEGPEAGPTLPGPRYRGRVASAEEGAKLNQSVRKAIMLLRATAEDRNANVSSLARTAGLPRATALRMIQTLEQEGFLLRIPGDDRVLLGPELLRLARNTDEQLLLREVSRPIIGELVATVRETVTLSVVAPDGGLDLVSQVDAPAQLRPRSWVGQRFPLHASASGKVLLASYDDERLERFLLEPLARFTPSTITTAEALLADLERVRKLRYAVTRDEDEEGLSGIATGIRGQADELLGVLTVGGPTQRLDRQRGRHAVDHLLSAAGRIEAVLRRGHGSTSVLEVIGRTSG